jgi:hypothetical protein
LVKGKWAMMEPRGSNSLVGRNCEICTCVLCMYCYVLRMARKRPHYVGSAAYGSEVLRGATPEQEPKGAGRISDLFQGQSTFRIPHRGQLHRSPKLSISPYPPGCPTRCFSSIGSCFIASYPWAAPPLGKRLCRHGHVMVFCT